jgi:hypothetical protein
MNRCNVLDSLGRQQRRARGGRWWCCGGGGAGDALGRVRCHKYWRAARTAAGQRRAVQNGRQSQDQGTRAAAQRQGRAGGGGRGAAEMRSEAHGGGGLSAGRGCGGVKKGFSKRVEEARRCGSEKEIQRDGRVAVAAITTHRTPYWQAACPSPNHSRRFHCQAVAAAPASANAATPSGPPFLPQ